MNLAVNTNPVAVNFKKQIAAIKNKSTFLLAVSGGADSMVLLDLFVKNKLSCLVAHANFKLRGADADADELLVQNTCAKHKIDYHCKQLNVKQYKQNHNASTQMAARELRYNWLKAIQQQYKIDWLVTAHHLDDSLETFLINLSRGTGLNGLCGIPTGDNHTLRPLLDCTKQEIVAYAKQHNIVWREDASNESDQYLRNQIRHHVVPKIKQLHPGFDGNFKSTLQRLQDSRDLIDSLIKEKTKSLFSPHQYNALQVSVNDLKQLAPLSAFLYHLFAPFGFAKPKELIKFLDASTGSSIQSKTHQIIKNRDLLLISELNHNQPQVFWIDSVGKVKQPIAMELSIDSEIKPECNVSFDADLIEFPLQIRTKQTADYFYPKGMIGKKKLSKYYKDNKFSALQKQHTWLLCNQQNQIIWVIGCREDKRFSSNPNTKQFLNINLCES